MNTILNKIKYRVGPFLEYVINSIFMRIPIHRFRLLILKSALGSLGDDSTVLLGTKIRSGKNIEIGSNSVINQDTLLDGRGGKLIIGDNVDIAQETNIWTLEHDPNSDAHETKGGNVVIENYVWIASRVTILPGIKIGAGAVVATGSVVTKDVPPMTIVGGVPAKRIGMRKSELLYTLNYRPKFR